MYSRVTYNAIGSGIYTIPDVAHILQLPVGKVSRWMREYWGSRLEYEMKHKYYAGEGKDRTTNFNTLVEFYVFYQLREIKISASKIFEAYNKLAKLSDSPYPFATHQLLANPKSIFYQLEDERFVNISSTQITHLKLIEDFCKKIEFSDDKIAARLYPAGKEKKIVVDPDHQFGQPVISGTNVLIENIYSMYESGEKPEVIGKLFDLTTKEVKDAIEFYEPKAA